MNRKIFLITIALFIALISYYIGISIGKRGFGHALDVTQGQLAYNHLQRYREIKSDLELGCVEEALEKLSFSIDREMMLLAEYVQLHNIETIDSYIELRDDALLKQLKSYKIDWSKKWSEKSCKKSVAN